MGVGKGGGDTCCAAPEPTAGAAVVGAVGTSAAVVGAAAGLVFAEGPRACDRGWCNRCNWSNRRVVSDFPTTGAGMKVSKMFKSGSCHSGAGWFTLLAGDAEAPLYPAA